jgi:hypothetical protein
MVVCGGLVWASGCKPTPPPPAPQTLVKTGGRELVGGGVTFLIPWEDQAGHSDAPNGLSYESETLKLTYARGVLYINATNYGALKVGDKVNLLNPGHVLVNDQERKQQEATGMFLE